MTQQVIPQPDPGENQLTFSAVIDKTPGMSLGLDVAFSSAIVWMRHGIFVKTVFSGGSVAAWNEGSEAPLRVQPGDLIVQVNAIQGDTLSMIQEMKVKQRLTLHILRRTGWAEPQRPGPEPQRTGPEPQVQAPAPAVQQPLQSAPKAPTQQSATVADANVSGTAAIPKRGPLPPVAAPAEPPQVSEPEPSPPQQNGMIGRGPTASEEQLSEAESSDGESTRGRPTVLDLLPQLRSLGSGTLGGIIVVALDQRPWLYEAVLGERDPRSSNASAGTGGSMPACAARYRGL